VSLDSLSEERNSIRKYFHDPSLMKNHRPYLGRGSKLHPALDNSKTKNLATDLSKIRNVSPIRFKGRRE